MPHDPQITPPHLEVENLGPIRTANIELRPLKVLVGPTNTGKSYLATLIYSLHRAISNMWRSYPVLCARNESANESMAKVDEFVDYLSNQDHSADSETTIDLNENISLEMARIAHSSKERQLAFEILRSLGIVDEQDLVRRNSKQKTARVRLTRGDGSTSGKSLKTLISEKSSYCEIQIIGSSQIKFNLTDIGKQNDLLQEQWGHVHDNRMRRAYVVRKIFQLLLDPFSSKAYYLPADRTGTMKTLMMIAKSLIASAPIAGLEPRKNVPMISGVLTDFLYEMIEMDEQSFQPKDGKDSQCSKLTIGDVLERMESQLLNGSIVLQRTGATNLPIYRYRPTGWNAGLPLMRASSMVSELAPLALYLRHVVKPNETLIIEEPESHLHPSMQVQLTELLAFLVRAGVRIIVTTHSDWIIGCLENIVLRGHSSLAVEDGNSNSGIDHDSAPKLSESDVGVWLFKKPNKGAGSKVKRLKFLESGHYLPDFDGVSIDLHNEWANLSSRLLNAC